MAVVQPMASLEGRMVKPAVPMTKAVMSMDTVVVLTEGVRQIQVQFPALFSTLGVMALAVPPLQFWEEVVLC